ncbi:MAG: HD-GYP domain-containing protein [Planctomycetota bacterium]|jgi:putative nucleotidyltransferase with HDIG domain
MSNTAPAHLELELAEDLTRKLAAAINARRIYAPGHSRAEGALREVLGRLRLFFGTGEPQAFRLTTTGGMLTHEGVPLGGVTQLAQLLEERRLGGIVFHVGVIDPEVAALVDWCAMRRAGDPPRLEHIELLDPGASETLHDGKQEKRDRLAESFPEFALPREVLSAASQVVGQLMDDARGGRGLDLGEIGDLTKMASEAAYSEGLNLFAATQMRPDDSSAYDHSINVFLLATTLLKPCVDDRRQLEKLSRAALLHDVGKSLLSQELVEKEGELTEEEFSHMKRHPEFGARILAKMPRIDPVAIEVAYCHHMRDDGHGYPTPQMPIKIGPVTHLVQVGDMFETISEQRASQQNLSTDQAVSCILQKPGMESKKGAMRLLLRHLTSSPPGSEVALNSGERAVVVEARPDEPDHPRVRVIRDADGKLLEEPYEVDLREAAREERPITEVYLKPR